MNQDISLKSTGIVCERRERGGREERGREKEEERKREREEEEEGERKRERRRRRERGRERKERKKGALFLTLACVLHIFNILTIYSA